MKFIDNGLQLLLVGSSQYLQMEMQEKMDHLLVQLQSLLVMLGMF